jgi:DNA-binding response OmpR family regulator
MAPSPRRVLLVDDEPHIGLLVGPPFAQAGMQVDAARTLAAARAALRASPPDVLLLDLHLPDGSGLDLLRALRDDPATRALPVLVLTAEADDRVLAAVAASGAEVVTKPFSPSKLTQRVLDALGPQDDAA